MQVRFVMGPAGSGKTFRCVQEIRQELSSSPEGAPLFLLAPNQTTYQLERQLLSGPDLRGYTRLHVLSFERLAHFLFDWFHKPSPELLDEEGRVMVLRALLARKNKKLKLFRASARLTGFAQQLSNALREFQQSQLTPDTLEQLAASQNLPQSLAFKLHDFASLLRDYLHWLEERKLQDGDSLLTNAANLLQEHASEPPNPFVQGLWVDGFAQFTGQEIELMAALLPVCLKATVTFCLEAVPAQKSSWLSSWSLAQRNFDAVRSRFSLVPNTEQRVESLPRDPEASRFLDSRILRHLEQHWAAPEPFGASLPTAVGVSPGAQASELADSLRVAICENPAAEATFAAREILSFVRAGHRFRDVAVLVRNLENYHQDIQRVFTRYEIPFFVDRRESMAHHPAAELTRSALRTVALGWQHEDWFATLKTGLLPARDEEIDELENEALARGWHGTIWLDTLRFKGSGRSAEDQQRLQRLELRLESLRQRLLPPFQKLAMALRIVENTPTGKDLAAALREFWTALGVAAQLEKWADRAGTAPFQLAPSIHQTVWNQMNSWLKNVEMAFAQEPLPLREWLPVLEAGLGNLTVGLIPPALDQVLVGAVDRSRNPEVRLGLLLGMNESVFPASPEPGGLLTDNDRLELEKTNALTLCTTRQQLSRERYYGYVACTRSKQRLVLTCSLRDQNDKILNPSPFLTHVRSIFPTLIFETLIENARFEDCWHPSELMSVLARGVHDEEMASRLHSWRAFLGEWKSDKMRALASALDDFELLRDRSVAQVLKPALAAELYGPILRTSVSRMEQFAACPFKFFVHSGLRAQERRRFELDSREQGSFQHDVLALFHEGLRKENKRWRDITPEEARDRVGNIANALVTSYREGLLQASHQTRFMARTLTQSLQEFVGVLVAWMRQQYRFDPAAVELPFGADDEFPAWPVHLADGHRLELYGRIDRVDLLPVDGRDEALCVIIDYKSSQKQLDPILMQHGLQLQLLAYLNVLRRWPKPGTLFGVSRLTPVGVFYVNLRGKVEYEHNRRDAFERAEQARKLVYRHSGRFDSSVLAKLDSRTGVLQGDQFNYRLTNSGVLHKSCREPVEAAEFAALLDSVEDRLREMGSQIYSGVVAVSPYRKGAATACQQCEYQSICRIDPWTHRFRMLRKSPPSPEGVP